jgi:arylsulfatase A-like enzyme
VLVIGIDGVRRDALDTVPTPNIDAIGASGFLASVSVSRANPTISGPVWATVATGVYGEKHNIRGNDLGGHRLARYPDFLSRVRAHLPGATTFAAAAWAPLVEATSGGPLFAPGGYRPPLAPGVDDGTDEASLEAIGVMDGAVVDRVAREILGRRHAAIFAYLLRPDMVAHAEGLTDRYRSAIERCDAQVGVLLAAISARPDREHEEWTVIVLTDHGHLDEGGHGGDSSQERAAWIAACGPGIDGESGVGVDHADVAAHVLSFLDVPYGEPVIEGRPFRAAASARSRHPRST